jgi:hypothetical protein
LASGTPLYWRDEISGKMLDSVMAFWSPYADTPENIPELSDADLANLKMYIVHWAAAPCWRNNPSITPEIEARLESAIAQAKNIASRADINKTLDALLDLGIDPF